MKQLSGRGIALTPDWKALYDQLTVLRLRLGLSSFLKYCSATGIDPLSVSETSVAAFISYASEVQFTVKPNDRRMPASETSPRQFSRSRLAPLAR